LAPEIERGVNYGSGGGLRYLSGRFRPYHANLVVANFELAINRPRGFNARERHVAALPRGGENLTEVSATFSTGYKQRRLLFPRQS
jgi:hypothetical protein